MVREAVSKLAAQIVDHHPDPGMLAIIGIRTRGEFLARRLAAEVGKITGTEIKLGTVDVTFHRDDFRTRLPSPEVGPSQIPFDVDEMSVILADDVLYTGRTVRAAINSIMDFGRPAAIKLAVLVDRGGRELPVRADYLALDHQTAANEHIHVHFKEVDGQDEVLLLEYDS
jgi:pyrimidine operon attenuation protein/uracil phosphoribosyltransferase